VQFEVGVKEYLYLLNFCMFDYSTLWEGNSLAPEWSDSLRTPAGIQANNPLGYALFNTNIGDVISKPSLATIRNIFQDGDVGNPTVAGASGYVADTAIPLTGNFTVNSNTATLEINTAKDGTTDGDKTLALTLDNAAATQNVSITDSSQNVGSTYFAYPAAMAIDEGSALTINVVTTDQSDGTLYWTIGSNASDFSLTSGNFAITSDNGSFIVTPTADAGTEGAETFTIQIRTGSISGNIVFTTPAITINDTSLTPTADYTINVGNNGASDYTLSGTDRNGSVSGNDPALAFNNGDVVDFVVSASGHPFWIKTAQATGTGSGATGVSNNGTQSGTVQWTVGSTGTFYYICQFHAGMVGTITAS
jgi:plastocyanin